MKDVAKNYDAGREEAWLGNHALYGPAGLRTSEGGVMGR
jgi:hypothetical protein